MMNPNVQIITPCMRQPAFCLNLLGIVKYSLFVQINGVCLPSLSLLRTSSQSEPLDTLVTRTSAFTAEAFTQSQAPSFGFLLSSFLQSSLCF